MTDTKDIKFPAKYYWGIKVCKELYSEGEIFLYADMVKEHEGNVTFYYEREAGVMPCFSVSKGNWLAYYAASLWDGAPTHVEHWKGEKGCPEDND